MRRAHGHGARKVYVGDVVAISCPSSFSPPYPPPGGKQGKDPKYPLDTHWKVGLVLALYADVAAEDDIDDTYSMTVLWLHRYVHLPKTPLFKEVHDKIKTRIEPPVRNSLLIESSDIETDIPFYRVLLQPRIALGEKQENIWGNQDQGEDFPMLLNLSCQYRFCGPEKNIIERTKGWELFNSTEQGTKAPDFLVKAWDNPNFPWHKDSSFKEKQMTFYEREVEEKMKDRIEIQKRLQEEADEDDGEPQQGNTENKPKAKKPTKPILKSSKSSKSNINKENNRSLSTKKQPPIKKKKEILSKNNKAKSTSVTKSTASKTKAKVSLKESKSSKPSAKNKKPAPKSSKGKKRAHSKSETTAANILSKKRRISSAEETDDSSTVMSEEDRLVPIPPSRRIKGKNITFFDGVELPWDTLRWDASLRKNHDNGSWKFHVGDIVAVACQESRHPPHLAQSKKPWFPYKVAWSAAQVLSIFENPNLKRTKGDKNDFSKFQMKVRFFFRWNELEDVAREHVKKAHPKAAAHLQKDIHAILESYAKGDTYNWPVTAAIGNLSFMGDNSGALSPQASAASLPPTVAVQCHYKLAEGEEEDENGETENRDIAPASNWVHYYSSDKRGLEPFLRSQLKFEGISTNFYTNSIKNRWGIKDTKRKAKCMTSPLVSAQSKQNNPIRWVPATWKMPHIDDDGTWLENVEKSSDLALFRPLRNSKRIHRASSVDPMNNRAPGAERALDFYDSLEIPLLASRFDPKFASLVPKILDGRAMSSFTVKVGDVVCFATANTVATSPRESCEMKSVYYPYKGSWKVGQVLAIHSRNVKSHRTRHSKDVCAEEASLEVRWLPRVLELPLEWQRHLSLGHLAGSNLSNSTSSTWGPPMANFDVIESDKVETIPATYVLGPTELLHGIYGRELVGTKTTTVATGRRRSNKLATPIIRCNLHNLFYWKQHNSVETIYIPVDNNLAADKCVEVARRTFFERGKSFSTTLKENTTLLETPSYKGLNPTQILSASQQVAWKFPPVVPLWSEPCNQNGFISDREYYGVVNITPPWESYLNPLCDVRDRSNLCWSVGVGDLVAVRAAVLGDTANNFGKQGSLFPFKERWAAAQVLAIYKDRSNSSVDEENGVPNTYLLQLRAFHCESDTSANAVEMVWETRKVVPADERCHASPPTTTDLIGPIILYPAHGRDKHHSVVVNPHSFLPEAPLIYGGEANGRNYSEKIARPLDILDTAKRGVYLSSHYKSDEQRNRLVSLVTETYQEHFRNQRRAITSLFQQFIGEVATKSAISDNSTGENSREECDALYDDSTYSSRQRVLVPNVPIHFDKSSKRSYFDRILVDPAFNNMAIRKAIESRNDPWEVKLGDIVAVHYTDNYRSSGPAYFEPCAADYPHVKREETPNFPFAARTPWGSKFLSIILCSSYILNFCVLDVD